MSGAQEQPNDSQPPPPPPEGTEGGEGMNGAAQAEQTMGETPPSENPTTGEQEPMSNATPTDATPTDATPTDATPPKQGAEAKESPKVEKKSNEAKQPEAKKPKKPTVKYVELPIEDQTSSMAKLTIDRAREKEVCLSVFMCVVCVCVRACNISESLVYIHCIPCCNYKIPVIDFTIFYSPLEKPMTPSLPYLSAFPPPFQVNMDYQDQLEKARADAKNIVEEYVYSMREKVEYQLKDFISGDESAEFLKLLNATEEWLYDEGEDQPKKVRMQ